MRIDDRTSQPRIVLTAIERAFTSEPWLRELKIGPETVGSLYDQQLRLGYRRTPGSGRIEIVPHSAAAATLLGGPSGARTTSVLQAVDGAVRVGQERSRAKGMAISETYEGFILNSLIDWMELGGVDPMNVAFRQSLTDPAARPKFQELVSDWYETNESNAFFSTWVSIYRRTGATMRALFNGTPPSQVDPKLATIAAQALGHELQHSITPATGPEYEGPDGQRTKLVWLEEGIAELTTQTIASDRSIARALGTPFDPSLKEVQYPEWTDGVNRLARLAGFDTSVPAQAQRAAVLGQHGTLTDAPSRYARAIARHHGLSTGKRDELTRLILDSRGEPANIAAIERWVAAQA